MGGGGVSGRACAVRTPLPPHKCRRALCAAPLPRAPGAGAPALGSAASAARTRAPHLLLQVLRRPEATRALLVHLGARRRAVCGGVAAAHARRQQWQARRTQQGAEREGAWTRLQAALPAAHTCTHTSGAAVASKRPHNARCRALQRTSSTHQWQGTAACAGARWQTGGRCSQRCCGTPPPRWSARAVGGVGVCVCVGGGGAKLGDLVSTTRGVVVCGAWPSGRHTRDAEAAALLLHCRRAAGTTALRSQQLLPPHPVFWVEAGVDDAIHVLRAQPAAAHDGVSWHRTDPGCAHARTHACRQAGVQTPRQELLALCMQWRPQTTRALRQPHMRVEAAMHYM
jgi:hypothetical protein